MQYTILLPGITGSRLADHATLPWDTVWDLGTMLVHAPRLQDLQLDASSVDDRTDDVLISASYPLEVGYRKLLNGLRGRIGDGSATHRVFAFGYDWRRSIVDAAQSLVGLVARLVRRATRDGEPLPRVNIVGHSLGGLVARQFMAEWDNAYPDQHEVLGKLVTLGTPHAGSLAIVREMVMGEGPLFNSGKEYRKVARTCASSYELLPRYDGAVIGPDGSLWSLFDVNNWQSNVSTSADEDVTQRRLDQARLVTGAVPDPVGRLGAHNVLCIAGAAPGTTMRSLPVKSWSPDRRVERWFNFEAAVKKRSLVDGDEVVPFVSATVPGAIVARLPEHAMRWFGRLGSMHATLPSSDEVQTIVHAFLRFDGANLAEARAALTQRWPVNMDVDKTLHM